MKLATAKTPGFTQVELGVVLLVIGILIAVGLPNAVAMIRNVEIRSAAETVVAGLNLARAEALRRNQSVEFALTNVEPVAGNMATLSLATTGRNWVVRRYQSNAAQYSSGDFIQGRNGIESSPDVAMTSDSPNFVFNGLGSVVTPNNGTNVWMMQLTPPDGAAKCQYNSGGTFRCLNVMVAAGGLVRLCDPSVTDVTDPRTCNPPKV